MVKRRKTGDCPDMTESCSIGRKVSTETNTVKQHNYGTFSKQALLDYFRAL